MSKNKRFEIQLLAESYIRSKTYLKQMESGNTLYDVRRVSVHRKIVTHIEHTVSCLSDNDRFIIHNEVIKGKTGDWFCEYFSRSTYFRHREKAYDEFLRCL